MVEQVMYSSTTLPPDLKCQIVSFLRVQWPDGFIGENRLRDWITKEADHPIHLVLVERGVVISHTNVVWKYLQHAGVTYKTYGLTGVFTYPAFRDQGYGGRIVAAGTDYIRASDADIAMLHCGDQVRDFYTKYGWEALPHTQTFVGPRDEPQLVHEVLMMQWVSPKGQRGKPSFVHEPVYFGSDSTW